VDHCGWWIYSGFKHANHVDALTVTVGHPCLVHLCLVIVAVHLRPWLRFPTSQVRETSSNKEGNAGSRWASLIDLPSAVVTQEC